MPERLVVVAVFEGANLIDIAGPLQAFESANRRVTGTYRLMTVSEHGGPVRTAPGLAIMTEPLLALDDLDIDTLIVSGGLPMGSFQLDGLIDWLGNHGSRARRLCSVCTGAFLLGDAGLLTDKRVTTHWSRGEELQHRHPSLELEADCLYINDGNVWTSGGVTAGIDLALALIEADLGHAIAAATARQLVVFMRRPGGQSQFGLPDIPDAPRFADLHRWIAENLRADLRVESLAGRVGMSPRNFARVYAAETGLTPARAVAAMRLAAAREALEMSNLPLKTIAGRTGLATEQNLRRIVQRQFGVGPSDYRSRFGRYANV